MHREFRYALSAYAELPPGSIYLIPVRLDDCEVPDLCLPELELNLRDLHWVDLFRPAGFDRLARSLNKAFVKIGRPLHMDTKSASASDSHAQMSKFQVGINPQFTIKARDNPAITAAWIGAAAVLIAGILGSPLLESFMRPWSSDTPSYTHNIIKPGSGPSTASQEEDQVPSSISHWMTNADYQVEFDRQNQRGYFPVWVEGKNSKGASLFRAKFEPMAAGKNYASHGNMPAEWHANINNDYIQQGYEQVWIQSFIDGEGIERIQSIWKMNK